MYYDELEVQDINPEEANWNSAFQIGKHHAQQGYYSNTHYISEATQRAYDLGYQSVHEVEFLLSHEEIKCLTDNDYFIRNCVLILSKDDYVSRLSEACRNNRKGALALEIERILSDAYDEFKYQSGLYKLINEKAKYCNMFTYLSFREGDITPKDLIGKELKQATIVSLEGTLPFTREGLQSKIKLLDEKIERIFSEGIIKVVIPVKLVKFFRQLQADSKVVKDDSNIS